MTSIQQGLTQALLAILLLLQPGFALPRAGGVQARAPASTSTSSSPNQAPSTSRTASSAAAKTCNGRSEYCNRSYSNVTFVGSHDSAFVGSLPQQNQNIDIKAQLDMGIRYLQTQTHHSILDDDTLELCHTSCFLEDAGTLKSYLGTVKDWLDDNPDEVVTLLLTNGDSVSITDFGDTFKSSRIDKYAFVPSSSPDKLSMDDWPTLGDLISSGKRLVVFLDYGADTTKVNYILDEFTYYFETPYDVTDSSFPECKIDRPSGASASGRMYVVNHFLDVDLFGAKVPDRDHAAKTNAATGDGSIGAQADKCKALYDRAPNVVLADFVDKGGVMDAQKALNGL